MFELDPMEAGGVGFGEPGAYVLPPRGLDFDLQIAPKVSLRSELNKANIILEGLFFRPSQDFNGSVTTTVTVNDTGATGAGGDLLARSTFEIFVTPVNDPPNLVVPRVHRRSGGRGSLHIPEIAIYDVDNVHGERVTVSIVAEEGSILLDASPNVLVSTVPAQDTNTSATTIVGLLSDVRRALSHVWFSLPREGWEGWTVVTFSATDGQGAIGSKEMVVVISDPNIDPMINAAKTGFVVDQGASLPLTGLNVIDLVADSAILARSRAPVFSVTVATDMGGIGLNPVPPGLSPVPGSETAANALAEMTAGRGLAGVFGATRSTLSFQGTLAGVNSALETLVYVSANGTVGLGNHSVAVVVKRRGKSQEYSARRELMVDVKPINQAPQVLWNMIAYNPELPDIDGFSLRGLSVSDSDLAGGGVLHLRLKVISEGHHIVVQPTSGVAFSEGSSAGIPSSVVAFRGNASSIAKALYKSLIIFDNQGEPRAQAPTLRVTVADDAGGETSLDIPVCGRYVNNPPEVRIQRPTMALKEGGVLERVGERAGVEIHDPDVLDLSDGFLEVNVSTSHRSVLEVQNITTSATVIHPVQIVTTHSAAVDNSSIWGTFSLTLDMSEMCADCGIDETAPIWHDAVANEDDVQVSLGSGSQNGESVQAKLQSLASLQALGITVFCQKGTSPDSQGGRKWLVTFLDAPATLPLMRATGDALTVDSLSVYVSYAVKGNSLSGSFVLSLAGYDTHAIPYNAEADSLAAALEAIPSVNAVHVTTPYSTDPQGGRHWEVTFFDATGTAGNLPLMGVNGVKLGGRGANVQVVEAVRGNGIAELWEIKTNAAHQNMVFVVTMSGVLRAKGFFQLGLDFGGRLTWTKEIYPQAVGAANDEDRSWRSFGGVPGRKRGESIEARLRSLRYWNELGSDAHVIVERTESADGDTATWSLTFTSTPEDLGVPVIRTASLAGGAVVSAEATATPNRVEGFFSLAYGGIETHPLPHDCLSDDMATALNSLSSIHSPDIGTGVVAVTRKQGKTLQGGRRWVIAFLSDPEFTSNLVSSATSTPGLLGLRATASASRTRHGGAGAILRLVDLGGVVNGLPGFSTGERLTVPGKPRLVTDALTSLSYTPRHGWNGQAEIFVRTFDHGFSGLGGPKSAWGMVHVNVEPVNDPPELFWCGKALECDGALILGVDEDAPVRLADYDCEDGGTPVPPTLFDHVDMGGPGPGLQVHDMDGWASIIQVMLTIRGLFDLPSEEEIARGQCQCQGLLLFLEHMYDTVRGK